MRVLIISYSNYIFDGRLVELKKILEKLGDVRLLISTNEGFLEDGVITIKKRNNFYLDYLNYSYSVVKIAIKYRKEIDLVFIDNITASLPAFIVRLLFRSKFYAQDVRELYFPKIMPGIFGKLLSILEGYLIKKSNVVICANRQRADIMKKYYKIERPYVFENIRMLGPKKVSYETRVTGNKFRVISTGGVSVRRGILKILRDFSKLPPFFELSIAGGGSKDDINLVKEFIEENNITNIHLLGKIKINELYDAVLSSQVGIVHYHQNDLNNIYCASGKVYEYLGCSIPIATTTNPPLKQFCDNYNVGIASDDFYGSLMEIFDNYDFYKKNAADFAANINVESNNRKLLNFIEEKYIKRKSNNCDQGI